MMVKWLKVYLFQFVFCPALLLSLCFILDSFLVPTSFTLILLPIIIIKDNSVLLWHPCLDSTAFLTGFKLFGPAAFYLDRNTKSTN